MKLISDTMIPALVAKLPRDSRGYPIPYFTMMVNGEPDFRYSDPKKKAICRLYRKCWICGSRLLLKDYWVITGPIGLENHAVSDEPMHEECARFSMKVCPHMYYEKAERKTDFLEGAPTQAPFKPTRLFLIQADKIWYRDMMHTLFRPFYIEEFVYVDNKLTPKKMETDPMQDRDA